jgi:hypothetical protein
METTSDYFIKCRGKKQESAAGIFFFVDVWNLSVYNQGRRGRVFNLEFRRFLWGRRSCSTSNDLFLGRAEKW